MLIGYPTRKLPESVGRHIAMHVFLEKIGNALPCNLMLLLTIWVRAI